MEATKICSKCKQEKSINQFCKNKRKFDNLDIYCKCCRKNQNIIRYKNNKDKIQLSSKIYYNSHILEYKSYQEQYYKDNIDYLKEKNSNYYITNKDKILNRINLYQKHRRISDPSYRLVSNMRTMLWRFLNGMKCYNGNKYICCSYDELWYHLEKQFKEGMTRENYGKVWHVDHIIPLQWFEDNDLMDETNKKIACHYGNLQPLFVTENLEKSDKIQDKIKFKYFNEIMK